MHLISFVHDHDDSDAIDLSEASIATDYSPYYTSSVTPPKWYASAIITIRFYVQVINTNRHSFDNLPIKLSVNLSTSCIPTTWVYRY